MSTSHVIISVSCWVCSDLSAAARDPVSKELEVASAGSWAQIYYIGCPSVGFCYRCRCLEPRLKQTHTTSNWTAPCGACMTWWFRPDRPFGTIPSVGGCWVAWTQARGDCWNQVTAISARVAQGLPDLHIHTIRMILGGELQRLPVITAKGQIGGGRRTVRNTPQLLAA